MASLDIIKNRIPTLKDTNNWRMVGGVDENGEAQELSFLDERVKTSTALSDGVASDPVPQNPYYGSLVVISTVYDQITRGKGFFTNYNWAAGLNNVQDIVIVTANNALIVSLEDSITTTLETQMDAYTGTTFTDLGTTIPTINRNGRIVNAATTTVYHSPIINVLGTAVYTTRWGTGNKAGAVKEGLPVILIPNTTYMFRITSRAAGNWITHEFHFTEDEDKS